MDEMSLLDMQASDCTHCREIQEPTFLNVQTINVLSAQRLNGEFVVKCLKSVLLTLSIAQSSDQWRCPTEHTPPPDCVRHDFLLQFSGKQSEVKAFLVTINNRRQTFEFAFCWWRTAFENAVHEATIDHTLLGAISKYAIGENAVIESGIYCQGIIDCDGVEHTTGYMSLSDMLGPIPFATARFGLKDFEEVSSLPEVGRLFKALCFIHRGGVEMSWLRRDS
jgi:hypothetical protein